MEFRPVRREKLCSERMPAGKFDLLIYTIFPGIQVFSEKRLAFPCFAWYFYSYEQKPHGNSTGKGTDT